jgi:hypothetical protein
MADASTNTTNIAADSVVVWNANSKAFVDVLDLFKHNLVEPDIVNVPTADAAETALRYTDLSSVKAPAVDGLMRYISQETARTGTVNKYYTTNRRTYNIIQSDSPLYVIKTRA